MSKEILKTGLVFATAIAARAGLAAGSIGAHAHRGEAHNSIELAPPLRKTLSIEQSFAGTTTAEWAANHRMHHHQFPDADLYNFWKTAHAIQHCLSLGMEVPEKYKGYDKGVDEFTREDVLAIGAMADEYLQDRLGDSHWTPDFSVHTTEQLTNLLEDGSPKYHYDESFFDKDHIFSDDEVNHILLRDQHSTALAPSNPDGTWNGVRYVFKNNVKLSNVPTRMYRQRPYLLPQDLKDPDNVDDEPVGNNKKSVYAGFAFFGLAAIALMGDRSPKGILKGAAAGSLVNALGLLSLKEGGDIVNSFGHMGPMTPKLIRKAIFSKNFDLQPNPDGTYASDTENGGFIGKLMSAFTLDESGKQQMHHDYPAEIAYDPPEQKNWKNTPFGSLLEYLADNPHIPFVKRGVGLPKDEKGRRADEAHPAMEIIWENRRRTMAEKKHG